MAEETSLLLSISPLVSSEQTFFKIFEGLSVLR